MTTDPHTQHPELRDPLPVDQSLRARALAKYESCQTQDSEAQADLTLHDVRQTLHELRVHQIELQMQNDELRQAQIALEESRSRFRDLYDHAPVGYCLITADGLIADANRTLSDMLAYPQHLLNGRKFTSLIEPADQDVFYHLRRRILESLQSQTCEVRMHRSDTTWFWIELSVAIASVDGDADCLRVALTNIQARVRAEADRVLLENQLRESQKMEAMGTLAGGIAHDFNNILTVILVNAEMTARLTEVEAPTALPYVTEIQRAADRARELVDQILAFCRRQPTNRRLVSLPAIIEESIGLLRATMPARFQLELTSAPDVPKVLADDTQIKQVIINLATNAMQAMDGRAGHLRIHLDTLKLSADIIHDLNLNEELWAASDSAVRINFVDDGPGMEPNVAKRIFEPFFTTKPVNQGTGLGLAVVHGIVSAHDGQISVKTKLGQGSAFTVYLPPARPATVETYQSQNSPAKANTREPDRSQSCVPRLDDYSIVYVDDDSIVIKSIVNLLRVYGVLVRGHSDPAAALLFLHDASNQVEMLVTDYNMPGISGLDFARQVHQIRPRLPVVVTSGYIDDELRSNAHDAGVAALIPKPFSATDFLDLLKNVG